jgi:hypothetical protein
MDRAQNRVALLHWSRKRRAEIARTSMPGDDLVKRILLTLLQFLAFGVLLVVGAFWAFVRIFCPSLAFIPVWQFQISATHDFVANGVIFAVTFFAVLILIEAVRKTLKSSGPLTVAAFLVAVVLGFAMKLGFHAVPQ